MKCYCDFPFPDVPGKRTGEEVVEEEEGNVRGWNMSKNVRRGSRNESV